MRETNTLGSHKLDPKGDEIGQRAQLIKRMGLPTVFKDPEALELIINFLLIIIHLPEK